VCMAQIVLYLDIDTGFGIEMLRYSIDELPMMFAPDWRLDF